LQTLFNPENGTLTNGVGSVQQNNGLALGAQNAYGDASKGGSGDQQTSPMPGISSPIYGTFHFRSAKPR